MARKLEKLGDGVAESGATLEFCNEPGCSEFAQSNDPKSIDVLKYKCIRHQAAALARGETGARRPDPPSEFQVIGHGTQADREERRAAVAHLPRESIELSKVEQELPACEPAASPHPPGAAVPVRDYVAEMNLQKTLRKEPCMARKTREVYCVEKDQAWPSVTEAAEALGCSKGGLGGALAPDGTGSIKGLTVRYGAYTATEPAKKSKAPVAKREAKIGKPSSALVAARPVREAKIGKPPAAPMAADVINPLAQMEAYLADLEHKLELARAVRDQMLEIFGNG